MTSENSKKPSLGVYIDSRGKVFSKPDEIQKMLDWLVGKNKDEDNDCVGNIVKYCDELEQELAKLKEENEKLKEKYDRLDEYHYHVNGYYFEHREELGE